MLIICNKNVMDNSTPTEHEAAHVNADEQQWPRTKAEATTFFKNEGVEWFTALPERLQDEWSGELLDSYKTFHEQTAIARALETKSEELAVIFDRVCAELKAQGLTFADLRAFDLQSRGGSPFSSKAIPKSTQLTA